MGRRIKELLADWPLRPAIAAALILGLLLPATLSTWYQASERRQRLFEQLHRDHARLAETLATGMQTPIWDVRPDTGQPLIDMIMSDSRVTAVAVSAPPVLPDFLTAERQGAPDRDRIVLEREVTYNGERIGQVRVEMTTASLRSEAARQMWEALITALLQMAFGLLLIFLLIRFKVILPVRRLLSQSQSLAAGDLDQPLHWQRRDELGMLGRGFEETRRSLQALVRDLELRNAEQLAARRETDAALQLLEAVMDAVPAIMHVKDHELRYRYVNRYFLNLFGLERGQVIGRTLDQVLRPEWLIEFEDLSPKVLASGDRQPFYETVVQTADGRRIDMLGTKVPLLDAAGRVTDVVTFEIDITERKRIQQALSDSEELYRLLVDQSPYGVLLHDARSIVFINRAGLQILGAERPEQVIGRHYREFIAKADLQHGIDRLARLLDPGEAVAQVERHLTTLDGRDIVVATSGVPFSRGDQRQALVLFVDITDLKQAEAKIARQREALLQAEKLTALGSLLAGVAHELNNPLAIVVGRSMMLEESTLDPRVATHVSKIREAAERCAKIVKTFLAIARQQAPARMPVRIPELIDASLELLDYGLQSSGIKVINNVPADLPATMADREQLIQVFNNLITNARQAMMGWQGVRELTLTGRVDPQARHIVISIANSGPCIPVGVLSRIFEPFFTTKPTGSGTGIGLAVSRGFIETHGGTIAVENLAAGVSFTVRLPIVDDAAVAQPQQSPQQADPASGSLLLVDDEPDIREILAEILQRRGYRITTAGNGREALAQLSEQRFDLIVSDLIMPDLDGPGLYQVISQQYPQMAERMIFITGDILSTSARRFIERVKRPVIEKPFVPDEVCQIIDDNL